ncbi:MULTISPECIES: DUF2834 domain-containing protein [Cyanophyceae]|uniref:DUF2834 domain-containing protein n=1 Tax=Leptolyngbya subtilissima DQ-A4 TaxID=2933933 RepID=A0ABV0K4V0_9CYAN|nr:DUF2834 domain-containing protein [Nodosilinea sp. FACHB-141]MBD2111711.1 DUF2834 domain-containing protein [Nodosilinea sp. FACHB-141]
MVRRLLLATIWIGFLGYILWLAPLDQPFTWSFAHNLVTLQWGEVNAYLMVIFWMMGVWPMIYACLMFADGQTQPFPSWPFFVVSNLVGVIGLIPYLLVRQRNSAFSGKKDFWLDLLDRRSTGVALLLTTLMLFTIAVTVGDWNDYVTQFRSYAFVHLISLDFCLMGLIFPLTSLIDDDMQRRGVYRTERVWAIALVPLFGPLIYLCWRPALLNLPSTQETLSNGFSRAL